MARAAVFAALLLASGCAIDPHGGDPSGPGGKADGDGEEAVSIVFVDVDQETIEWAKHEASAIDGQPIGEPAADKRFRELYGRLQGRFNETDPLAVAWTISFGPSDGEPTHVLQKAIAGARVPVVLALHDEGEPTIYELPHVTGAHAQTARELIATAQDGAVSVETGRFGMQLEATEKRPLPAPRSIAVATVAGLLEQDGTKEAAGARADQTARCLAERFTVDLEVLGGEEYEALEDVVVVPMRLEGAMDWVSAGDVLADPEMRDRLAGKVIVVGGTWPGYGAGAFLEIDQETRVPAGTAWGLAIQRLHTAAVAGCQKTY